MATPTQVLLKEVLALKKIVRGLQQQVDSLVAARKNADPLAGFFGRQSRIK